VVLKVKRAIKVILVLMVLQVFLVLQALKASWVLLDLKVIKAIVGYTPAVIGNAPVLATPVGADYSLTFDPIPLTFLP